MKRCIGLCVARIGEYMASEFYMSAIRRAKEYGYGLLTYDTSAQTVWNNYSRGEMKIFDQIDFDRLDGLIIMSESIQEETVLQSIIDRAREKGVFIVCIDRPIEGCYNVMFNYSAGFEAIVRHIVVKHGCTDIMMMAGIRNNAFSDERIDVCRRVMAEHGLTLDSSDIMYGDFWSGPTSRAMDKLLRSDRPLPQAIICCNDSMAMAVCAKLTEYGYSVPGDVIITGFDGIFDEEFHIPRLTTAKQDMQLAAEKSIDAIIANRDGRTIDRFALIDHRIVWSHSCGCKPIDYREATGRISVLFDMMTTDKEVDTVMQELNDDISASSDILSVAECIRRHSMNYDKCYYCLCVSEHFMNISSDYSSYLSKDNDSGLSQLVVYESFDGHAVPPYCGRKPRFMEDALDKYGALLFWPVHFQEMTIGYGICSIMPEIHLQKDNGVLQRFPKYTRNLNHSLEIANSQSVMRKVISELQALYIRDHTGLYNRRGFYDEIHRRIDKALEDEHVHYLVIISIDMDGLKMINDTYGHSEGDIAIQAIADSMLSVAGESEICSRFGGDEFIISTITRRAPKKRAAEIMAALTEALDAFNSESGKPYSVKIALGFTYKKISSDIHVDDLIKSADNLMYREKATHTESRYSTTLKTQYNG